ncbi:MAG: hypothetical protein HYZ28_11915 [Myxococcales bacterium]|nr:hypothetical protein [Myxococcales bacterium]
MGALLCLLLATSPATPELLLSHEGAMGLGLSGVGYTHGGGRWGDLSLERVVSARLVFERFLRGLTADASLGQSLPPLGGGVAPSTSLSLRAGYTGERFSLVGGAVGQYSLSAQPRLQLLPTFRAQLRLGELSFVAGVFDYRGQAPAHLTFEVGDFGLGYVAPMGALVTGRIRLAEHVGLEATALAFRLANAEVAMLTISAVAGPRSGRAGGNR